MPVHAKLGADDRLHMGRPAESGRVHDALDLAVGRGDRLNLDSSPLVAPGGPDRGETRRTRPPGGVAVLPAGAFRCFAFALLPTVRFVIPVPPLAPLPPGCACAGSPEP